MLYISSSQKGNEKSAGLEDYEKLFRSPVSTTRAAFSSFSVPPIEPTPLSLDGRSEHTQDKSNSHLISPNCTSKPNFSKTDTRDAALLLASIKKLAVKESISLDSSQMPSMPKLELKHSTVPNRSIIAPINTPSITPAPGALSHLCSAFEGVFEYKKESEGRKKHVTARARTVSVDSHHHLPSSFIDSGCVGSSFRTDALPKERISLDLTSDQDGSGSTTSSSRPAHISPPSSPVLQSYKVLKENGPQGISKRKRQFENLTSISEATQKKKKHKARPSMLRTNKEPSSQINGDSDKKVLRKKFSWKNYPELEDFLIANREEYLRHSAMNYTMQQKEYNNRLTERLLELASDSGYVFDEESFSFVAIRDRIRCYFKSYVQSKKKRGLILGYAARRKGLISEAELEKSAGIKGTIVVPKKSNQKKNKASV